MLCNHIELILLDGTQSLSICGGHIQSKTTKNFNLQAHMPFAVWGHSAKVSALGGDEQTQRKGEPRTILT